MNSETSEIEYTFEAEKFALTEDSIHLLRNRFSYAQIPVSEINSLKIEKDKDLKTWLRVFLVGILLLAFVVYDLINVYLIMNESSSIIYLERLIIPLLPLLLGTYALFTAFRTTLVLKFKHKNKSYYLSLKKLIKNKTYDDFVNTLMSKNLFQQNTN